MALKNMISIQTTIGYKNIEIHQGDISAMKFLVNYCIKIIYNYLLNNDWQRKSDRLHYLG